MSSCQTSIDEESHPQMSRKVKLERHYTSSLRKVPEKYTRHCSQLSNLLLTPDQNKEEGPTTCYVTILHRQDQRKMDSVRFVLQLLSTERKIQAQDNIKDPSKISQPPNKQAPNKRIDVDKPLWDQETYIGRWKHFAFVTDCRTIFVSEEKLKEAKKLCKDYRMKKEPKDTKTEDIIYAKKLCDSSLHPDNCQPINLIGRMSFQLPGYLIITAGMLAFYKTARAVVGWQLINQGFNTFVNYANRKANVDDKDDEYIIPQAFVRATAASCLVALGFRKMVLCKGPLAIRWAPFLGMAVGSMVNLPIVRQREILKGIPITSKDAEQMPIINSKIAAVKAISECVVTRIVMVAPGMILIPVIMNAMIPYCFYQARPWIGLPVQTTLCAVFLVFMIPSALAIYPLRNSMKVDLLKICEVEFSEYQKKMKGKLHLNRVYYNKGL